MEPSLVIDDSLRSFLDSGVSLVIGTRDAALVPEIVRAWGPRVSDDPRSVTVCVPLATSGKARENLDQNGRIAATASLPTTYRTFQLKGRVIRISEPEAADLAAVNRHRDAFGRVNRQIGVPREQVEAFWKRELVSSPSLVAVRFVVEAIFDQTPGPSAGARL